LLCVEGSDAHGETDGVGLDIRKMIRHTWKVRRVAVSREDMAGNIVTAPQRLQRFGIGGGDGSELRVPASIPSRRSNVRHCDVMDHPAFIPAAFVINNKQTRDVGEHVDERLWIIRISWQSRLWFEHDAN